MKPSDVIAFTLSIVVAGCLVYAVANALDRQDAIDRAKTAAHVGQMDESTKAVIGGGK